MDDEAKEEDSEPPPPSPDRDDLAIRHRSPQKPRVKRAPSTPLGRKSNESEWEEDSAPPAASSGWIFDTAVKIERALLATWPGRALLLGFAIASPVDLALDIRMGSALADLAEKGLDVPVVLPLALFFFLYLGLRLQVLLLLGTSDAASSFGRHEGSWASRWCGCLLALHLGLRDFSARKIFVAWLPFGLQFSSTTTLAQFLHQLLLEVLYVPCVAVLGPLLVVYGTLSVARELLGCGGADFWRSSSARQVRMVRATLISLVSTSVTAIPQISIQTVVYASAAIELTPYARRLVVASITFSFLSLLRSICGLLAAWRRIQFTWQRVNRTLDEEVFNSVLHECADQAESGDQVKMIIIESEGDIELSRVRELRLVNAAEAEKNTALARDLQNLQRAEAALEKTRMGVPLGEEEDVEFGVWML